MSHTKNDYPDNLAWCIDCSSDAGTRRYYSPAHVDLMLAERDAHSAALVAALETLATTMGCQCLTDKYPGDEHDSVFCVTIDATLGRKS